MCLMAQPVIRVANTNIFVGTDGKQQVTVYQMEVGLKGSQGNAMVLPVPAEAASEVSLMDLSDDDGFFQRLGSIFAPRSRSLKMCKSAPVDSLEVIRVGSYDVSIAPSIEDIDRVDPSVFTLSDNTAEVLREHYEEGYVFVVAKLREGGKLHPLGYTSPLRDTLFIPTRHEHGHEGGKLPKWDHNIYVQGTREPLEVPSVGKQRGEHAEASANISRRLQTDLQDQGSALAAFMNPGKSLYRWRYQGRYQNIDLRTTP